MKHLVNDMSIIRIANTQLLLRTLYNLKEASRSDLTRITKLSSSAVTSIVKELMDKNLIIEKGVIGERVVGRPKSPIDINDEKWYALGLHISDIQNSKLVLFNLYGKRVLSKDLFFERMDLETISETIFQGVKEIKKQLTDKSVIIGLGVGISGIINDGNCVYSESLKWNNIPIGAVLNKKLDIPVVIECDVNALALAEYINLKNTRDISSLAVLMLGNGVGLGLIFNGNIYSGHCGGAGEISHILNFNYDNYEGEAICHCGNKGCISNFITKKGIINQIRMQNPESDIDLDEPLVWINSNVNEAFSQIIQRVINSSGMLLKLITETYDPETIIISASYEFDPQIQSAIDSCYGGMLTLPERFKKEVIFKKYFNTSWAWGAAYTVIHQFLNSIEFWKQFFN